MWSCKQDLFQLWKKDNKGYNTTTFMNSGLIGQRKANFHNAYYNGSKPRLVHLYHRHALAFPASPCMLHDMQDLSERKLGAHAFLLDCFNLSDHMAYAYAKRSHSVCLSYAVDLCLIV